MKITKFGKPALWRSIAAVSSIVLCLAVGGTAVTTEWSGYINKYLGISNTTIVQGDSDEDPIHYKSDYSSYTEVMNNAREVAKQVQAEGTVLMVNDDENGLPLEKNSNVTFFGYNQVDIAYGGTGSGGVTPSAEREVDLISACEGKLGMNKTIYDFYQDKYDNKVGFVETTGWGGTTMNFRTVNSVNEINAADFTQEVKDSYADYGDAAIYIITRIGGEGSDLSTEGDGYLALDENERSVLEEMKEGDFDKRIVILNTFNAMELGWVEEYDIDAVLYIGGPGEVGMDAVTDILIGEINPSGHLADTYAYDSFSSPAMQNFGDFEFANSASITNSDSRKYVMYNEGIYVGYRYYETRYEDTVLGNGDASSSAGVYASSGSSWKYEEEVQFPFGWGMSYSDFTQTLDSVEVDWDNKTAEVTVTVTNNTPDIPGKDVVQVYAQAPYTEGGVEKSAIQLCGFAKTQTLDSKTPSQTLTITVDLADIASYDYENYKTYIMDAGDYYFAIGDSAHDALNNVLAAKNAEGMTDHEAMPCRQCRQSVYLARGLRRQNLQHLCRWQGGYQPIAGDGLELLERRRRDLSFRSDWQSTYPKVYNLTRTSNMVADDTYSKPSDAPKASEVETEVDAGLKFADLFGVELDEVDGNGDNIWDKFIDQLSIDELISTTIDVKGIDPIKRLGFPGGTNDDGIDCVSFTNCYVNPNLAASSWDEDMFLRRGEFIGEDCLFLGLNTQWGPGANMHRSPFSGRNFEYLSEDSVLYYELIGSQVAGTESKGVTVSIKHFFANDQEQNRGTYGVFANEQALREIYLRPFEGAFVKGGATTTMTSNARAGFRYVGETDGLINGILHGEWDFYGVIITDAGRPASLTLPNILQRAAICSASYPIRQTGRRR